ncbi:MAG: TonB-dependent receptor [Elusimicrobiota bacterium]
MNNKLTVLFVSTLILLMFETYVLGAGLSELINDNVPHVVITATRTSEPAADTSKPVYTVTSKEISEGNTRTITEIVKTLPGVFMQKTTHGHGSPVIRGFIGRENLILIDGVRLNNSTFRSGPVQYMNTVDSSLIDRLELTRGPSSVLYGSDALGGVINIITKSPASIPGLRTTTSVRYNSADNGISTRAELNGGFDKLSFLMGGTYKNLNDLRAGGSFGVESPTGYSDANGDAKVVYQISDKQKVAVSYQHTNQFNVPRYEKYTGVTRIFHGTGGYDKFVYNPQIRQLGIVQYDYETPNPFLDNISAKISYHRQYEGSQQQKTGSTKVAEYEDTGDTLGTVFQLVSLLSSHKLVYGLEYYNDTVVSQYSEFNTQTGVRAEIPANSTFPDGSKYSSFGMFIEDQWKVLPMLKLVPGVRYSMFEYNTVLRNTPLNGNLAETFSNFSGSLGAVYNLTALLNLCANVSQGFRAPNLDDVATLRTTNQGIDVPSYGLKPEKSNTYEIGIKAKPGQFNWSAFYYYSDITDKIDRKRGTYNGANTINGIQVYQKFNIGSAKLQGVELDGQWYLDNLFNWSLSGMLTYTDGWNITDSEPLMRIPPVNGMLSIRYDPVHWWIEPYIRFADKQDKLSSRDKEDPRIDPNGTPGWVTYNLRGGWKINRTFALTCGIENILDTGYREHGSGVDSPGVSVQLGLDAKF